MEYNEFRAHVPVHVTTQDIRDQKDEGKYIIILILVEGGGRKSGRRYATTLIM